MQYISYVGVFFFFKYLQFDLIFTMFYYYFCMNIDHDALNWSQCIIWWYGCIDSIYTIWSEQFLWTMFVLLHYWRYITLIVLDFGYSGWNSGLFFYILDFLGREFKRFFSWITYLIEFVVIANSSRRSFGEFIFSK